eukprot:3287793-Rhodomonas_salina.5
MVPGHGVPDPPSSRVSNTAEPPMLGRICPPPFGTSIVVLSSPLPMLPRSSTHTRVVGDSVAMACAAVAPATPAPTTTTSKLIDCCLNYSLCSKRERLPCSLGGRDTGGSGCNSI